MKSGLEDRNNAAGLCGHGQVAHVSMKSGLEDRNNSANHIVIVEFGVAVSMKSGLEDRNNAGSLSRYYSRIPGLNEVRPGRPEQYDGNRGTEGFAVPVSMKSGLEDRNNTGNRVSMWRTCGGLNEVRPGRPEQFTWRPTGTSSPFSLNEVRPGRPEQYRHGGDRVGENQVSMKSGLEDRNNK